MARKRLKKGVLEPRNETSESVIPAFLTSREAQGVTEATIESYRSHFKTLSNYLDLSIRFDDLSKEDIDAMVVSMRHKGLAHNTVANYCRVMRTFLTWCNAEGYTDVEGPKIKPKETIKETYTDEELEILLRRPPKDADFPEYRNWVMFNFLLNSGCRAGTISAIQNRDVYLDKKQVLYRHTKSGRVQVVPLCNQMVRILKEYMSVRKGDPEDYLFCNQYGEYLCSRSVSQAIRKYNKKRAIRVSSVHAIRHSFARKFLLDCGGDAFTLQKLLGHSTLAMTKHYCAIFDSDITENYDKLSPLAQMNQKKEKIRR